MSSRIVMALPAAAMLALAACAPLEQPESPGYEWRWVGQGPPGSFAADERNCRRHVDTPWRRQQRASSDRISRDLPPDRFAQRREFWQCMKGRGWAPVER